MGRRKAKFEEYYNDFSKNAIPIGSVKMSRLSFQTFETTLFSQ